MRPRVWPVQALLLEAIARDALGDADLAERALERALDLAEPEGLLVPFLLYPAAGLLERHRRLAPRIAALISEILDLLAGKDTGTATGRNAPTERAAHGERDARAALPADQPIGARDRG